MEQKQENNRGAQQLIIFILAAVIVVLLLSIFNLYSKMALLEEKVQAYASSPEDIKILPGRVEALEKNFDLIREQLKKNEIAETIKKEEPKQESSASKKMGEVFDILKGFAESTEKMMDKLDKMESGEEPEKAPVPQIKEEKKNDEFL